uniref:DUF2421 domain-containing protein n=1 Tax=Neobodo designis TaxID=312471 RepID=A0A7S1MA10_NEODS|mmetsp:Transcript_36718/g.113197  ORF Transcript_36718/g.113197 Transcript_36718/m.113197 type:complete len:1068 (+) Transcript_36718:91-3294(+)
MSDVDSREPIHDHRRSPTPDEFGSPAGPTDEATQPQDRATPDIASPGVMSDRRAAPADTPPPATDNERPTSPHAQPTADVEAQRQEPDEEMEARFKLSVADGLLGNMSFVPAVGVDNSSMNTATYPKNNNNATNNNRAGGDTNKGADGGNAASGAATVNIGPMPTSTMKDATTVAIKAGGGSSRETPHRVLLGKGPAPASRLRARDSNTSASGADGTGRTVTKTDIPPELRATDYCTVPWAQRTPYDDENDAVGFIGFFNMTPHVMLRIEFALRCACVGILPAAALAYNANTKPEWAVPSLIVTVVIVCASHRIGSAVNMVWQAVNALVLAVCIAEILIAIDIMRHWAMYYAFYAVIVWLVATFTGGFVSKLGLFFITIFFVLIDKDALKFKDETNAHIYPLHFAVPVLIGCAIGLAIPLLPFPRTHRGRLEVHLRAIFSTLNICFIGVSDSLWTADPLERRINYVRIQSLRGSIRKYFDEAYEDLEAMSFEPWSGATYARARQRLQLAESLLSSLDGMLSIVGHLTRSPSTVDDSARAQIWGQRFRPAMVLVNDYMDEFTKYLHDLWEPVAPSLIEKLQVANDIVDAAYRDARSHAFADDEAWKKAPHPERSFPFVTMGYYLFNYGGYLAACLRYDVESDGGVHESNILKRVLTYPLRRLFTVLVDIKDMATLDRPMLLRAREALKLSFAMTTALALLLFLNVQDPAGGAAVIGFVKEADPAITVLASLDFVVGTALGSVLGFLAASMANDLTELVAYMCVLAFLTGFMRSGKRYGPLGFLCMFFALSAMAPGARDSAALLEVIQQNVAAMLWLGITHLVLYPTWPSDALADTTQRSLFEVRAMLLAFTSAIEYDKEDLGDVDTMKSRLVGFFGAQARGIQAAMQEPSVKKLDFPHDEALALLRAQEDIHRVIGPAILAARVEAAWSREDRKRHGDGGGAQQATTPQLLPDRVMAAMREHLPQVHVDIDQVLRAVETTESACSPTQEMTAVLLETHQQLQDSLLALNDACTREFVAAIASEHAGWASPFRMPAVHTMMHFFAVIGPYIHRLLTATVHLRRIRQIRG